MVDEGALEALAGAVDGPGVVAVGVTCSTDDLSLLVDCSSAAGVGGAQARGNVSQDALA